MDFVIDRTQADVDARNSKGTYNYTDLNRVIANANQLADDLTAAGFPVSLSWTRTTYTRTIIPTADLMAEFLQNIQTLRDAMPVSAPLPTSMSYLTYEGANDIERMQMMVDELLGNLASIFPRAGVWPCGGVIYEVTNI